MDLSDLTIQPGKIHLVREILHDGITGSVRVLGSLKSYDAAANGAVVEYKGHQLDIDATLLTDFQFRIDSLYEFIGEIQDGPGGKKKVKARVCRNVDGLDTHLFEKALQEEQVPGERRVDMFGAGGFSAEYVANTGYHSPVLVLQQRVRAQPGPKPLGPLQVLQREQGAADELQHHGSVGIDNPEGERPSRALRKRLFSSCTGGVTLAHAARDLVYLCGGACATSFGLATGAKFLVCLSCFGGVFCDGGSAAVAGKLEI